MTIFYEKENVVIWEHNKFLKIKITKGGINMADGNDIKNRRDSAANNIEEIMKNEWINEGFGSGENIPENNPSDIGRQKGADR